MTLEPRSPWKIALRLEYFTIAYNVLEALASIAFGLLAGSIALVGFGLDSIVESFSGVVLVWRLRRHGNVTEIEETDAERLAERLVAASFSLLGLYVLYISVNKLVINDVVQPSPAGIIIAVLSLIIMPVLAWKKRAIGNEIKSRALIADAKETAACALISAALLLGLLANWFFKFWQADPVAGIVIALFLFNEGYKTWYGSCLKCEPA